MQDKIKRLLVGTFVGRSLMSFRDKLYFIKEAFSLSGEIGTLQNDQLASELIAKLSLPNKSFIDVGAHIGSVTAEVLRFQPSVNCFLIEAMPDKINHLKKRFPMGTVVHCAAGETEGEMPFYIHRKKTGFSSLVQPTKSTAKEYDEVRVSVSRLDKLVPVANVDTIKIDVEGAELAVLRGALEILKTSRPTIMFESAPKFDSGLGLANKELWRFLSEQNYCVLIPNRLAHNDPGLSLEAFCESHLYPRRTTNYFAVANERREEVRDRARKILGISTT